MLGAPSAAALLSHGGRRLCAAPGPCLRPQEGRHHPGPRAARGRHPPAAVPAASVGLGGGGRPGLGEPGCLRGPLSGGSEPTGPGSVGPGRWESADGVRMGLQASWLQDLPRVGCGGRARNWGAVGEVGGALPAGCARPRALGSPDGDVCVVCIEGGRGSKEGATMRSGASAGRPGGPGRGLGPQVTSTHEAGRGDT